jgi:predicted PolB exonuclease-like 3'-5' exonuclease
MLVFDCETAPLPNAADYLDPVTAAGNLKDPVKIAASIAERDAERREKMGLDWNLSRIVALGWTRNGIDSDVAAFKTEDDERLGITGFWAAYKAEDKHAPRLCGFNAYAFDLPFLIQRSRYLGIAVPPVDRRKYDNRDLVDLFQLLTFDNQQGVTSIMPRSLKSFCRRFGIEMDDTQTAGKDISSLIAADNWHAVECHCARDVAATYQLAKRMGVLA